METERDRELGNVEDAARAMFSRPGDRGFSPDPEYAAMTRREQRRYRKAAKRELNRALSEAKSEGRRARAEVKAARRAQAQTASDISRQLKRRAAEEDREARRDRRRRGRASDTAAAIGYDLMFSNGVCQVERGLYSRTFAFDDICFQNSREDHQRLVCWTLMDVYNYLGTDTTLQWSLVNLPLREDELRDRRFFDPDSLGDGALAEDAETLNAILAEKLAEGISNMRTVHALTVAVRAADPVAASRRLARIATDLTSRMEQVRCHLRPLDGTERLGLVQSLLRPQRPFSFSYDRLSLSSPETTKDHVAPQSMDFAPGGSNVNFTCDGRFCQVLAMRNYDTPLNSEMVSSLIDMQVPIEVTWFIHPIDHNEAVNFVKTRRAFIDTEIVSEQKRALSEGYDYSILPSEVKYSRDEAEALLRELQGQGEHRNDQQNLFEFSGLVYTWADTLEDLNEQVLRVFDTASAVGIHLETLEYRQRDGLNSALPLGLNLIEISRPMTTSEASIFVPFATQELEDEGGAWYYQNRLSNNLVFGDRSRLASPIGFISGKTGSGKGFFAKNEIEGTILTKPRDQVIIFDRAGEYRPLVEHADGAYASFGVEHVSRMNPLGMEGLEGRDFATQVSFKADAIIAQASAVAVQDGIPITEGDRSMIQRAVETIYRRARETGGPDPVLSDLYAELKGMGTERAEDLAMSYDRYVNTFCDFFNDQTNIDLDSRIVGLNFRDVPESMLVFALISFCETVRYIMYRNYARHQRTWLYIEEMESLFKYPSVLEYFRRFSNECRKYGMFLTGITQSTDSMVRNEDANAIVKNSDFIVLMRQSKEDRDYWEDALGLSPEEVKCIDESTPRGWGLLVFGDARIPIKGEFPKGNRLYELYSTDPNEWERKRVGNALSASAAAEGDSDAPTAALTADALGSGRPAPTPDGTRRAPARPSRRRPGK